MRAPSSAATSPSAMPTTPPSDASTAASTRNWRCTSRSIAPTASRMPISRVRSVTDTSMMFMMPMPPTPMLTAASAPRKRVSARVVPMAAAATSVMSRIVKSSPTCSTWRRWRSSCATSPERRAVETSSRAAT
jgi:hypothetical protein